jgi:Rrf2 family protein
MKISTRTEYGMRILLELARRQGEGPVSLSGVAKREKLPHAYLEQLVGQLRRAGLVAATRGQAGGYQLARPAAEITMADAVRALEGPLLEMPCAGVDNLETCDRPVPCSVHELFQGVYEALAISLGSSNLADMVASAGGPPYPPAVRKRRTAQHAALAAKSNLVPGADGAVGRGTSVQPGA